MDRLLRMTEIESIIDKMDGFPEPDFWDAIAKSQLAKTDTEWVEWLEEPCYEHPIGDYEHDCKSEHFAFVDSQVDDYEHWHYAHRKDCPTCWQERKKEIGL